jgi:hypothetical protein
VLESARQVVSNLRTFDNQAPPRRGGGNRFGDRRIVG